MPGEIGTFVLCEPTGQKVKKLLLGINKDSPETREVPAEGEIDTLEVANGLHHFCFRRAA